MLGKKKHLPTDRITDISLTTCDWGPAKMKLDISSLAGDVVVAMLPMVSRCLVEISSWLSVAIKTYIYIKPPDQTVDHRGRKSHM